MNFSRENQTKKGYSVCFVFPSWTQRDVITVFLILIAVRKPILDLFCQARVKVVLRILESDEVK